MEETAKWIIVGGDGLIGSYLSAFPDSTPASPTILSTTRRKDAGKERLFADLSVNGFSDVVAAGADVVFLCAAMTNMQQCRQNPELSRRINVTATVNLAAQLVERDAFVIFLSSNTVFNGSTPWPDELQPHDPGTEYGAQKAEAERQLLNLPGSKEHVAIVRISKVLSSQAGVAAEFLRRLRARESCQAFSDLKMSPISLRYVASGLRTIATRKRAGIFHLSGADEPSYAEMARRLASQLGADQDLVRPISSAQTGVEIVFRPTCPGLGMARTTELLGIRPEPMEHLLAEITGGAQAAAP